MTKWSGFGFESAAFGLLPDAPVIVGMVLGRGVERRGARGQGGKRGPTGKNQHSGSKERNWPGLGCFWGEQLRRLWPVLVRRIEGYARNSTLTIPNIY